jgi:hypothetical protein
MTAGTNRPRMTALNRGKLGELANPLHADFAIASPAR